MDCCTSIHHVESLWNKTVSAGLSVPGSLSNVMTENRKNSRSAWRSLIFAGVGIYLFFKSLRTPNLAPAVISLIFGTLAVAFGIYTIIRVSRQPTAYGGRGLGVVGVLIGSQKKTF